MTIAERNHAQVNDIKIALRTHLAFMDELLSKTANKRSRAMINRRSNRIGNLLRTIDRWDETYPLPKYTGGD